MEYTKRRIAKGSLAEALTRRVGRSRVKLVAADDFEEFDQLHYEIENKLVGLIESLESKRGTKEWQNSLPQRSNNSTIQ
jgi:hypothetical protein